MVIQQKFYSVSHGLKSMGRLGFIFSHLGTFFLLFHQVCEGSPSFHHNVNFKITRKLCLLLQFLSFFSLLTILAVRGEMSVTEIENNTEQDQCCRLFLRRFPLSPSLTSSMLVESRWTHLLHFHTAQTWSGSLHSTNPVFVVSRKAKSESRPVWCLQINVCTCNYHYDHLVSVFF